MSYVKDTHVCSGRPGETDRRRAVTAQRATDVSVQHIDLNGETTKYEHPLAADRARKVTAENVFLVGAFKRLHTTCLIIERFGSTHCMLNH